MSSGPEISSRPRAPTQVFGRIPNGSRSTIERRRSTVKPTQPGFGLLALFRTPLALTRPLVTLASLRRPFA
jgi:hypothetical protein